MREQLGLHRAQQGRNGTRRSPTSSPAEAISACRQPVPRRSYPPPKSCGQGDDSRQDNPEPSEFDDGSIRFQPKRWNSPTDPIDTAGSLLDDIGPASVGARTVLSKRLQILVHLAIGGASIGIELQTCIHQAEEAGSSSGQRDCRGSTPRSSRQRIIQPDWCQGSPGAR